MSTTTIPRQRITRRRGLLAGIVAFGLFLTLGAGSCDGNNSADRTDKAKSNDIQEKYQTNQPIPDPSGKSQLRGNLIDIEKFQIEGGTSWSYFFATGRADGRPVFGCPSIGDPIPSTDQITNPDKTAGDGGGTTIGQMEPTGVFTGVSAATNVICLAGDGKGFKVYWEGEVGSSTVELQWDEGAHMLVPKPGGGVSDHAFSTGSK